MRKITFSTSQFAFSVSIPISIFHAVERLSAEHHRRLSLECLAGSPERCYRVGALAVRARAAASPSSAVHSNSPASSWSSSACGCILFFRPCQRCCRQPNPLTPCGFTSRSCSRTTEGRLVSWYPASRHVPRGDVRPLDRLAAAACPASDRGALYRIERGRGLWDHVRPPAARSGSPKLPRSWLPRSFSCRGRTSPA